MSRVLLISICLGMLFPVARLSAQHQNIGVSLTPQAGFLLAHRSTMAHLNTGHSLGGQLSLVIQTNGSKQWHHDFNFPRIELNSFYYDLGNPEILGNTFGVSAGMYLPFFKNNGWSLGSLLGSGLAYVTEKFDLVENPKNNVIGSYLNSSAHFGVRVEKQFSTTSLGIEISMTHISNGAFKLPNLGLNLPYIGFNYTHFFKPLHYEEKAITNSVGLALETWAFHSQLIGSFKQIYPTGGSTYGVVALTNYFQYRVKNKFIIEGGIDAIYNQSIIKYNQGDHGRDKNFQLGLYGAYVLPIGRFQMIIAMGRYVINPLDPAGQWYHKLGGRFQITERLWGNFTIKSHWAKADYFEYGLSYRWK